MFSKNEKTVFPNIQITPVVGGVLFEFVQERHHVFEQTDSYGVPLFRCEMSGESFEFTFHERILPDRTFHANGCPASLQLSSCKPGVAEATLLLHYELPTVNNGISYEQITGLKEYTSTLQTFHKSSSAFRVPGMPGWGVALLVVMGLFSSLLLVSPGTSPLLAAEQSQFQLPPPAGQQAPALVSKRSTDAATVLSLGDQLNGKERELLVQVVKQSAIETGSGSKSFVVFSDPNCPACRELEGKLSKLNKDFNPLVVPVSFKPNSKESVAGILCSKDVVAAWRKAISGGEPQPGCEKGIDQATTNNAVFVALKFDSTPTIVTSNGKVARGAKDFDGLMRWVKENSGE